MFRLDEVLYKVFTKKINIYDEVDPEKSLIDAIDEAYGFEEDTSHMHGEEDE